jgi:hypothetical protein
MVVIKQNLLGGKGIKMVKGKCCDFCCDDKQHTRASALMNRKTVKVYFCPKCGSKEVGFVFRFGNAFGVIPKMECKKCGFNGSIFPLLVLDEKALKKENDKINKKVAHNGATLRSRKK